MAVGDAEWGAAAVIVWVVLLVCSLGLAALQAYLLSELELLEEDRVNLYDFCPAATRLALADMAAHAALSVTLLLLGHWVLFLLQVPLLVWNVTQYRSGAYEWDETQVLDRRYKDRKRNELYARTVYYALVTVYFLYRLIAMIITLVTGRTRKGRQRSRPWSRWNKGKK